MQTQKRMISSHALSPWMKYGCTTMIQKLNKRAGSGSLFPFLPTQKVQDSTFSWEGDGVCVLGLSRRYPPGFPVTGLHNNRPVLCNSPGAAGTKPGHQTPWAQKERHPPVARQCSGACQREGNDICKRWGSRFCHILRILPI